MPEPIPGNTPSETPFATLDPLGFDGRIGRLRFLVWSTVITLIAIVTGVLVLLAVNVSPTLGITCGATLAIAYAFISLRIGAQRLHDLNWSAWMLLLHLVPMAVALRGLDEHLRVEINRCRCCCQPTLTTGSTSSTPPCLTTSGWAAGRWAGCSPASWLRVAAIAVAGW